MKQSNKIVVGMDVHTESIEITLAEQDGEVRRVCFLRPNARQQKLCWYLTLIALFTFVRGCRSFPVGTRARAAPVFCCYTFASGVTVGRANSSLRGAAADRIRHARRGFLM